jgi:hypothetical protein
MAKFGRAQLTSASVQGNRATTVDTSDSPHSDWEKVNGRWVLASSPADDGSASGETDTSKSNDDGANGNSTNTPTTTTTTTTPTTTLTTTTTTLTTSPTPTSALPNQCSPGLATSSNAISCELAGNVFYEYYTAVQNSKDTTGLSVWSPVTKQYYPADCSKGASVISCRISGTTEPNAEVQITQAAVDAYTPQNASDYAARHDLGPNG